MCSSNHLLSLVLNNLLSAVSSIYEPMECILNGWILCYTSMCSLLSCDRQMIEIPYRDAISRCHTSPKHKWSVRRPNIYKLRFLRLNLFPLPTTRHPPPLSLNAPHLQRYHESLLLHCILVRRVCLSYSILLTNIRLDYVVKGSIVSCTLSISSASS